MVYIYINMIYNLVTSYDLAASAGSSLVIIASPRCPKNEQKPIPAPDQNKHLLEAQLAGASFHGKKKGIKHQVPPAARNTALAAQLRETGSLR